MLRNNTKHIITSIKRSCGVRSIATIAPAGVDSFYKIHSDSIIPVDSSWYMPNVPINGYHEFMKKRFSDKAVFFDIDKVKDHSSKYPHMLPSKINFEREVDELGIKNDSDLLLYDQQGVFSACRAAWMFEVFGHDPEKIYLLNTYLSYQQSHSDPNLVMKVHSANNFIKDKLVTSTSPLPESDYKATFDSNKVVSFEKLLELVKSNEIDSKYHLIDARSHGRFTGEVKEPRPGVSSGHIKNAINIPYDTLLTPQKAFLSTMSLKSVFKNAGVDGSKPIITMCGTGVTACVVRFGLQLCGFDSEKIAVYDGSWTEWGQRAPKEFIV